MYSFMTHNIFMIYSEHIHHIFTTYPAATMFLQSHISVSLSVFYMLLFSSEQPFAQTVIQANRIQSPPPRAIWIIITYLLIYSGTFGQPVFSDAKETAMSPSSSSSSWADVPQWVDVIETRFRYWLGVVIHSKVRIECGSKDFDPIWH